MAWHPSQIPLLRRPGTSPQAMQQRFLRARQRAQARASGTSSFPILPATAAALVLLAFAQLAFWWWESRLPGDPATVAATANPFVALTASRPAPPQASALRQPQRVIAPALDQNLQFGDAMPRVNVTIFTDPSCGPCRAQVQRLTAGLPVQGVRQVYKFWPKDPARVTPGMLTEIARRSGVAQPFWRALQGSGDMNLDDERLIAMLDRAGLPLTDQRAALTADGPALLAALEPDLQTAREARLPPPPVFMVDDMVLDGEVLNPTALTTYVRKRLAGHQLNESETLFLMNR